MAVAMESATGVFKAFDLPDLISSRFQRVGWKICYSAQIPWGIAPQCLSASLSETIEALVPGKPIIVGPVSPLKRLLQGITSYLSFPLLEIVPVQLWLPAQFASCLPTVINTRVRIILEICHVLHR